MDKRGYIATVGFERINGMGGKNIAVVLLLLQIAVEGQRSNIYFFVIY